MLISKKSLKILRGNQKPKIEEQKIQQPKKRTKGKKIIYKTYKNWR